MTSVSKHCRLHGNNSTAMFDPEMGTNASLAPWWVLVGSGIGGSCQSCGGPLISCPSNPSRRFRMRCARHDEWRSDARAAAQSPRPAPAADAGPCLVVASPSPPITDSHSRTRNPYTRAGTRTGIPAMSIVRRATVIGNRHRFPTLSKKTEGTQRMSLARRILMYSSHPRWQLIASRSRASESLSCWRILSDAGRSSDPRDRRVRTIGLPSTTSQA